MAIKQRYAAILNEERNRYWDNQESLDVFIDSFMVKEISRRVVYPEELKGSSPHNQSGSEQMQH